MPQEDHSACEFNKRGYAKRRLFVLNETGEPRIANYESRENESEIQTSWFYIAISWAGSMSHTRQNSNISFGVPRETRTYFGIS